MPRNTGHPLFAAVNDAVVASFGEPFTLVMSWADGASEVIENLSGVFDARHYEAELGGQVGVSEYIPALSCRRDAVPDAAAGHQVLLRGACYRITDLRRDSEGMVVLILTLEDDAP